jgi:hypothetical protein
VLVREADKMSDEYLDVNAMPYRHTELYERLRALRTSERQMANSLDKFEAELIKEIKPNEVEPFYRDLGYTVERTGVHDGMGDEYVVIQYKGDTVLGVESQISGAYRSYINAWIAGHAVGLGVA